MRLKFVTALFILAIAVVFETGCATKKYVRNRIAERVQPLEDRTSELEETSRRNTQQINEIRLGVDEVRSRATIAQETADRAAAAAEQANARVAGIETDLDNLRSSLDKYALQNTAIVFFRPGSTVLTPEAMAQLDALASQITGRTGYILEIVGYGDNPRATRHNQDLAQLRALAVQRYLANNNDIPIMRMYALGFGASRPLTQVSTENLSSSATRAMNRTVEIRVLTSEVVPITPRRTAVSNGQGSSE